MSNNKPTKYRLDGRRFGHLYVRKYAGHSKWICDCDCGKTCEILTGRLIGGHVKSCGCKGRSEQTGMLKDYVFDCLDRFGNTVISKKTYDTYGEKAILDELLQHGFNCKIRIAVHKDVTPIEKYIIIELD